jgi:hypothetical protein
MSVDAKGTNRLRLRRGATRGAIWLTVILIASVAGNFAPAHRSVALAVVVFVAAASILTVRAEPPGAWRAHAWIPYTWMALFLLPTFRFQSNDPLNTSASASSPENVIQVLVYAAAALLILRARRRLTSETRTRIAKLPMIAWPTIAVVSALWSPIPLFTLVRAGQLWVLVAMALLMVRIGIDSPERLHTLLRSTLRLFVQLTTILCTAGFLFRPWPNDRFTWPGTHPIVASMYLAIALLIVVSSQSAALQLRRGLFLPRIGLFSVALFLGETRGALAALAVGFAVVLWMKGRAKPMVRYVGLFYYLVAVALVVGIALPQTLTYLERGGGIEGLTTLSGRVSVWEQSADLLTNHGRWLGGFGYASSRVLLPVLVSWAGTAHSYWVELLLDLGVVGMSMALLDIAWLFVNLRRPSLIPSAMGLGLLAFTVVFSVVSEAAAFPGAAFGILALIHVPALYGATVRSSRGLGALTPNQLDRRSIPAA